ncbi:MAG: hypothetical protein JWL59_1702 [Chthoniobacteraceae bacterium]|nr:hypothetical protein [Chthoniobacteraceae bacterium]
MRLLFIADLHYTLKQFDWVAANAGSYDLVIIGGDLLDLASPLDLDVQIVVIEKYLNRIRQKTALLVSSGNHDGDSRNAANESVAGWLQQARAEGLSVDGDSLLFEETVVTACPWWDGPASRAGLEALLTAEAQKRARRWIWSHHSPPSSSPISWSGKQSAGDAFLREWIVRFEPDIVLCGHIHNAPFYPQGSWIDRIGKTWIFNPGRQPGQTPTHINLDLDAMTAEWISAEGESIRHLVLPGI